MAGENYFVINGWPSDSELDALINDHNLTYRTRVSSIESLNLSRCKYFKTKIFTIGMS